MSSTTLSVVVVGGGFGGLTAAIECKLRGMNVTIIEKYPTSADQGDVIDFFPNGGRIIAKWADGRVGRDMLKCCINQGNKFEFYNQKGEFLCEEPWNLYPHHYPHQFAGHRGEMHELCMNYAKEIGVEVLLGQSVVDYLGSDDDNVPVGVVLASGEKLLADVVVAADGPRSMARQKVLKLPDTKVNSGYAIFRAFFTMTEEHKKNPLLKSFSDPNEDMTKLWAGPDVHCLLYSWNKGNDVGWVVTHKDDQDIGESWSFPGTIEDTLKYLDEGSFEERFKEVVRQTPPGRIVDYKLVWRDPLQTWLSQSGRTVVIGDAAHTHLPSSGQGGAQALEDGVTLAVCLDRAKGDVKLALKVFERIRFNRSHIIHMSGVSNRDGYHQVEWTREFVEANPGSMTVHRLDWVIEHDAEKNAEEHFEHLAADVKSGKQGTLEELSLPAGGHIPAVALDAVKSQQSEEIHIDGHKINETVRKIVSSVAA
ncbi:unnamed protein product [Clonostachys rosea]|uniref:FAD-binding domain-containing protein n=1 Tax=Bionectria ochroleuca TaxID=29856 RepID=A0ABY6U2T3_BIOOC|nr:unnamed protein product [Clonostachys rosea]